MQGMSQHGLTQQVQMQGMSQHGLTQQVQMQEMQHGLTQQVQIQEIPVGIIQQVQMQGLMTENTIPQSQMQEVPNMMICILVPSHIQGHISQTQDMQVSQRHQSSSSANMNTSRISHRHSRPSNQRREAYPMPSQSSNVSVGPGLHPVGLLPPRHQRPQDSQSSTVSVKSGPQPVGLLPPRHQMTQDSHSSTVSVGSASHPQRDESVQSIIPSVDEIRQKMVWCEYPLSSDYFAKLQQKLKFVAMNNQVSISYSEHKESITICGFRRRIETAQPRIEEILQENVPNFQSQSDDPQCFICYENPKESGKEFGLLENCDHVACLDCITRWINNRNGPTRLNCPVCRVRTHIIAPYPEPLRGDRRRTAIANHIYKCSQTPCMWSAQGQHCPDGRNCIYDHSRAPQVTERPHGISLSELFGDSDDEDSASFLLQGGIHVYSDSDAESLDFSDTELAEAMAALRRARVGTGRARRYPRRQ